MKETPDRTLRKLLCFGLITAMVLFSPVTVFAIDEAPGDQSYDENTVSDSNVQEVEEPQQEPQTQPQPASSSETDEPEPSATDTESAAADTANTVSVPDQYEPAEAGSINTENASADIEVPEQPAGESNISAEEVTAPSEPAEAGVETEAVAAAGKSMAKAANSSSGKTIHIGDTEFDSGDDESSQWSDGKGWKNIAGQYIAMVDFTGSEAEISADEGTVTLAVAGVNRIKALKGNCSYNIVGSGIVLIDSIDIEDGNGISLMPNSEIYNEGSAAVFLKQDDNSYVLINGSVPGILDETYTLDGVNLIVPDGSSLKLGAMCIRTETWTPDGSDEPVTDVTYYMTDMPAGSGNPAHANGTVRITDCGSRIVIGENSTLTVDSEASVHLNKLRTQNAYLDTNIPIIAGELIIQGAMNVIGVVTGGYIEVQDGGSLSGTGAVKSAEVELQPAGNLDVPLEESILTVNSNADGSDRTVALTVKDSTIYLRGTGIDISKLNVSGSSTLSIDTRNSEYDPYNKVGNIALSQGGNLDIAVNKYDHVGVGHYNEEEFNNERDGLTDSYLEIYGGVTGGTVSVLAGCVKYYGPQFSTLPAVPAGYASRVFINGFGTGSTLLPLNMSRIEAQARAILDEIPVMGCVVFDDWDTQKGMYRVWRVNEASDLGTVSRSSAQQVTYPSLLAKYGLLDENGQIRTSYNVAVELIYSDFSRRFLKADDYYPASAISENTQWNPIPLNDVIAIRVMQYIATGGFGGSTATHTMASVTGSGVIGSPGSGNMKAGNGSVIYGVKYVEPEPVPEPVDPDPVKPEPVNPDPVKPEPAEPEPANPEPANPEPVAPEPGDPGMVNPAPADPSPVTPEKLNKDKDGAARHSGSISAKVDSVKTVSTVSDAGSVVSISLCELTAEDKANRPDMPQLMQLSITDGGTPVTELSGTPVKVTFPFTIPESWGDPAEIDNDSLYAVFADEDDLSAYKAEYDPETGEMSFETEQTGYFVIVQFKYEGKPLSEDFYKALAEQKEIKDFLAVMNDNE